MARPRGKLVRLNEGQVNLVRTGVWEPIPIRTRMRNAIHYQIYNILVIQMWNQIRTQVGNQVVQNTESNE